MDRTPKLLDADDEKRRRERRRREREARHRDGKSSRSKKPHYQLDIIDKLDVTSIYGTGSECLLFPPKRPTIAVLICSRDSVSS